MAQGDGNRVIRNAAYRWTFPMRNSSGNLVTGESVTAQMSLDGGGFSTIGASVTEIGSSGIYIADLTAAEFTGDEIVGRCTSSGASDTWKIFEPESCLDSGVAQASAAGSITLRSAVADGSANDTFIGSTIEIVRGTGVGQCRKITDYVTSTKIATIDRNWITNPDTTSVYVIHGRSAPSLTTTGMANANIAEINEDSTAAENAEKMYQGALIASTVNDASPTTTSFATALSSATDDFYNNSLLAFTSGTLIGLARKITDYTGSSKTVTVSAFPSAPSNGDAFIVISNVQ